MRNPQLVVFDLGGVIIDLFPQQTTEAFEQLNKSQQPMPSLQKAHAAFFHQFEKGEISPEDFRAGLQELLHDAHLSAESLDRAWNAMLGDIPNKRLERVLSLRQHIPAVVLSNTNVIHEKAFHRILQEQTGYQHLQELFDAVYFSHEIGLRKPNANIFDYVEQQHKLQPQDILLLDDTLANIEAAKQKGWQTLHVASPDDWLQQLTL